MTATPPPSPFLPQPPDAAGVISWVHVGDLHMTAAGEQNHRDLISLVEEVNRAFAASISFVYLPGDVADHGSAAEYGVVRAALDKLNAPWCCIVGDHDVHEKSFENFSRFMSTRTHYSFKIGPVTFLALNAFDRPDPGSFCLLPEQLDWVKKALQKIEVDGGSAILFLHCYPSDLKEGGEQLKALVQSPAVRLIDMGHTHYNELANDGRTLYTATRSTGQIEEGGPGFSVTNIDGNIMSWKFLSLDKLPAVIITSPADERFITDASLDGVIPSGNVRIRAKVWSGSAATNAVATLEGRMVVLSRIAGSNVWAGTICRGDLADGVYPVSVRVEDVNGGTAEDAIRVVLGTAAYRSIHRAGRDQDNAVEAWPERGLLGTQLGPNKNGRKW